MKKQLVSSACGLALVLVSTTGFAGEHGKAGKFMEFFDTNGDGSVTLDEFDKASVDRFKRIDSDNNGKLSQDEFSAYFQQRRAERRQRIYAKIDSNGDGQVSKEEYLEAKRQRAEKRFARMDTDANGIVSPDEFSQAKRHRHTGKRDGKRVFARIDANDDGVISRDESQKAWGKWFARMDLNKDSVVTTEEVRQSCRHRHEKREDSHK